MAAFKHPIVKRSLFVLPSLFTLSSIFCGFLAICVAASAQTPSDLARAALLILFAMVFDGIDGRVARLTRTQSEFGVQLDSLADVISFGAAPAFLIYQWGLHRLPGWWGEAVCFVFVGAGACRLARFNVIALRNTEPTTHCLGLPIPAASALLVSLLFVHVRVGGGYLEAAAPMAAVVLTLAYLMVSNIRYPMFKRVKARDPRTAGVAIGVIAFSLWCTFNLGASFLLVAIFAAYVSLGLTGTVVAAVRERRLGAIVPELLTVEERGDGDSD